MTFSQPVGWILLTLLLYWDAGLTYSRGQEGNPLWAPLVDSFGLGVLWVLPLVALALFYLAVEGFGWVAEKVDKLPNGRNVVLTNLVIVFATYDVYLTWFLPQFGWLGSRSHFAVIPVLLGPFLIYQLLTEVARRRAAPPTPSPR
jgi:hypothetical protein